MKIRFPLQTQVFFSVLAALLMGWTLAGFCVGGMNPAVEPGKAATPKPFTTLPQTWMVRIRVDRQAAPQVIEVKEVSRGRITATQGGESKISLLSLRNEELYSLPFHVQFSAPDMGETVSELEKVLILPKIEGVKTIKVITPQGETRYEFPEKR